MNIWLIILFSLYLLSLGINFGSIVEKFIPLRLSSDLSFASKAMRLKKNS